MTGDSDPYDLVVLGGGTAGLAAAEAGAARTGAARTGATRAGATRAGAATGARVLLVTDGEPGGECTFTGCVPSKTMIEAAARGDGFDAAMTAVHRAVGRIARTENAAALRRHGIEVRRGRGVLTGPGRVSIDGHVIRARRIVLATGAGPAIPPIPGLADAPYLTSQCVFDLTERPASLAIIGGGAVACELAQAMSRLGSTVTILEVAPRLLPAADPAASRLLARALTADGVTVRTGCAIRRVTADPSGGVRIDLPDAAPLAAERLLVAAGRTATTAGMGLDEAGVRLTRRGMVAVDRHLATAVPGVYAAGDCTGLATTTHGAFVMGRLAARNALRRPGMPARRFATRVMPQVVFTDPEVAQVGMTEQQAAEVRGARVVHLPLAAVDRAVTAGRTAGFVKLITGPRPLTGSLAGGRVLGATIVAPRAGEMVDEVALAMQGRMFAARLALTTHAYPTWSLALQQAAGQLFAHDGGRGVRPARAEPAQPNAAAGSAEPDTADGSAASPGGAAP